jgi:hypothetical protein
MARRTRGRDWQERAFEERENQRRDSTVGVPSDMPDPYRVSTDLPRRSSLRWTAIGLIVIVAAVLIRSELNNRAPSLTKSCTTPAIALSSTSVRQGSTLRYTVTGPSTAHVVIGIGVASFTPGSKPGQLRPVPDPGGTPARTEVPVNNVIGSSCIAHSYFEVGLPKGKYTVRLFRLTDPGQPDVTATAVESKPLTVN